MQDKTPSKLRYIYGPVPSWRLGASLGIDPVSRGRKICSFNCLYCQIGKKGLFTRERSVFIETGDILDELLSLPPLKIDYITFSGAGEPTLAANLGEMIRGVRKIRKEKIAVITNASLFPDEGVRRDLALADFVIAKLDAPDPSLFKGINKPVPGVRFPEIIEGLKVFRKMYSKRLALQIMFIQQNKDHAGEIARVAREIRPDQVQLNTPLRPCGVKPLRPAEISRLEGLFSGLETVSVYQAEKSLVKPVSDVDTLKRRGKVKI